MMPSKLLIANRGEIAIRIARAAAELGMRTVAVFSQDDADSLHIQLADEAQALSGMGAAAYLDVAEILRVAQTTGCDAIHPGYGFLSENAAFARRCAEAHITFVGPRAEILELFGDKIRARAVAARAGVPILPGTGEATSLEQARVFFAALPNDGAMVIKAVAGGGGRGMRLVSRLEELEDAYARCQSEAQAAFGNGEVYVEQLLPRARHIEVQIVGDGSGAVSQLGERDCSMQRRYQKLVEIAPAPGLPDGLRQRLLAAAITLAEFVRYDNIGTFEFLVDATALRGDSLFAFIEANPRLQVEHTVTEEVLGIDLVATQLALAGGKSLAELGLRQADIPAPRGFAMQVRVNMETMRADGSVLPSGGTLVSFNPPSGPGIRVDSCGYAGYTTNPRFDSLLAKLIAHRTSGGFVDVVNRISRALTEFRVEGVLVNIPFLQRLLQHSAFQSGALYTRLIDDHLAALLVPIEAPPRFFPAAPGQAGAPALAGARVDPHDPLAVLTYGKQAGPTPPHNALAPLPPSLSSQVAGPPGTLPIPAPLQGTVVSIDIKEGDPVGTRQRLLIMESMKMEHEIQAGISGIVRRIAVAVGDTIYQGYPLVFIEAGEVDGVGMTADEAGDLATIRPDLKEVLERHALTLDEARPTAVARRRARQQRTARENVADLCDPGTFVEYGALVLAAQRQRRSVAELIDKSPADGMVTGVGAVNGAIFGDPAARCVVMAYDYTVFAGTQGQQNHRKTDRMIDVAEQGHMPVVLFAEGGGGRPGDTDGIGGGAAAPARSHALRNFPGSCPWSGLPLADVLPGTPRCWGAAT